MKEWLQLGVQIGGWSLVLLVVASLAIPRVLGWREQLAGLSPLMRELWWTYSAYVWASHAFFSVLLLCFAEWLTGGSGPALAVSIFMLSWWSVRLGLQWFGFDLREAQDTTAKRLAKHLLTLLFVGLVTLHAGLVAWNLGWRGGLP